MICGIDQNLRELPPITSERLLERKNELKKCLFELTKKHHDEFLKGRPESEQKKDYISLRSWHSDFPVHKVPSVPEADLPVHPLAAQKLQSSMNIEPQTSQQEDADKAEEDFSISLQNPSEHIKLEKISAHISEKVIILPLILC